MAEKIPMLALSPTMETGVIVKWHKQPGDQVESGDVLCEVETDKAVMEYESSADGTLLSIVVPEGGNATVGTTIAIIGSPGEDTASLTAGQETEETTPETPPPTQTEPVAPATPQPTEAAPSEPAAAKPPPTPGQPKSPPTPGQPKSPPTPGQPVAPAAVASATDTMPTGDKKRSTPLARAIAAERGLDWRQLTGSGPAGRIIKRDVIQAAEQGQATRPAGPGMPDKGDQIIPVSSKRRTIAERLVASKFTSPHYYLKTTARMDWLVNTRHAINAHLEPKISLNAFLIKLTAAALAQHPAINASWNGDTITRHRRIDIALAVALEDGLITPVVRECAAKSIREIDQELRALVEGARAGRLVPEQYSNATFTISNLGSYGIEEFTAIINPPAAAILAVGKIRPEPVVDGEAIRPAQVMTLTLGCDHRLLDGAVAAAFLADLRDMIETPLRALL